MRNRRLIQVVALACGALLIFAASTRAPSINTGRAALNLLGSDSPLENTPPEYVFYIQAFGAFRGLIADMAFIRSEQLKEQGRFYDAMQLHKWICALQPYFPSVWEYAAWNMAWNISVTTFTPEERWNWVYNGVKLLRDQGIQFNPKAVNLYKQLAWTFNNKMSEPTDDQHYAYKCNWAWRMHLVLGPPPPPAIALDAANIVDAEPDVQFEALEAAARKAFEQNEERRRRSAEERRYEYKAREMPEEVTLESPSPTSRERREIAQRAELERLVPIRDAATTLEELYARAPQTREMVSQLRGLGLEISDDPLTEDGYWRDEGLAFTFFLPYRQLTSDEALLARILRGGQRSYAQQARMANLDRVLGIKAGNPAGLELVRFLQRKVLVDVYKLDPAHMVELVQTFGPLDWRSVDAQALYWTSRSLIAGGETVNQFGNDKTNTARVLFFSLRNLFLRNHITFDPNPEKIQLSYLNLSPDFNFIETMHEAFVRYGPLFDPDDPARPGSAGDTYRSGHINFLTEAIQTLYLAGREQEAGEYYNFLRRAYPTTPDGRANPAFEAPLHDFVMNNFKERLEAQGLRDIVLILNAFLPNAFNELAAGDVEAYLRRMRVAREYHDEYMRDKRDDPGYVHQRVPEFREIQIDAFAGMLAQPPTAPMATLHKIRLWTRAPLFLRQAVYDELLPYFQAECDAWDFDLAQSFPEPADMALYREQNPPRVRGGARPDDATSEGQEDVQNLPRGPND